VNVATLSFVGPTQDVTVLVQGLTVNVAALGALTTIIPDPPAPPGVFGTEQDA
jgi:hypothetical protein